ncbi:LuxR C-terminal-related transcriptional regulator [Streptomyces xantholiticus]
MTVPCPSPGPGQALRHRRPRLPGDPPPSAGAVGRAPSARRGRRRGRAAALVRHVGRSAGSGRSPEDDCPPSRLTGRERQIPRLATDDHDTGHIAEHPGISPKTVRHHLSRIFAELGTPSRLRTTLYAKRFTGRQWQPDGVPVEP